MRDLRAGAASARPTDLARPSFAISQHSKNLLEAFKHSNPPPPPPTPATPAPPRPVEQARPVEPPRPADPRVKPVDVKPQERPTPSAPTAAAPAAPRPPAYAASAPRASGLPRLPAPPIVLAGAGVLLLVLAFFLGRWTKGDGDGVEAKSSDRPSLEAALGDANGAAPAPSASEAGLLARPQSMTAADAALLDARNRYTVKAIQYDANEKNLALAKEVCAHFAKRSLPVCTPYQRAGALMILVGAAPNTADLEELQRAVKSIDSPNGAKGDFASAYIAPIDNIVQRNH